MKKITEAYNMFMAFAFSIILNAIIIGVIIILPLIMIMGDSYCPF